MLIREIGITATPKLSARLRYVPCPSGLTLTICEAKDFSGTTNAKLSLIGRDKAILPSAKAIAGKFKVNSSSNPQQLDLTFGDLTTQTIYEIGNDGQLKIANTVPDQPRPTTLDAQTQQLTKVSDNTNIASDIKILRSPDLVTKPLLCESNIPLKKILLIPKKQDEDYSCPDTYIKINP